MSYEGREVMLCEIGHVTVVSASSLMYGSIDLSKVRCQERIRQETCGQRFVDIYSIDDTNCYGVEPDMQVVAEAETCVCVCGNLHTVVPRRFAPKGNGWRKIDL